MNIVIEETITDAEAKEILEKREKEGELKYEQKNALDILRKFSKVSLEKIKFLVEELKKIEKLRERHIAAIADFLPQDKDDLRVIFQKEYSSFTEDEINLILETVKRAV